MRNLSELLKEKGMDVKPKIADFLITDDLTNIEYFKEVNAEVRNDKQGNECVYIDYLVEGKDGKRIRQKYTKTQYLELANRREAYGEERLKAEFIPFEKLKVGKADFERYFPMRISTDKKKKEINLITETKK